MIFGLIGNIILVIIVGTIIGGRFERRLDANASLEARSEVYKSAFAALSILSIVGWLMWFSFQSVV